MKTSFVLGPNQFPAMFASVLKQLQEPEMTKKVNQTVSRSIAINANLAQQLLEVGPKTMGMNNQELSKAISQSATENLNLGLSLVNDLLTAGEKFSTKIGESNKRTTATRQK